MATRFGGVAPAKHEHEHVVPVAAGEPLALAVDRVHCLALVELEPALAVGVLDDAGVLVLGLTFPDDLADAGGRLRRTDRENEEYCDHGADRGACRPAASQPGETDECQRQGEEQERALGADHGDQQQRGQERPGQRTDGADGVEPPGDPAGVLDGVDLQAHGVRRDHAEQQHRNGDQHAHAQQRPDEQPARELVEGRHGQAEERSTDERDQGQQRRGPDHAAGEPRHGRVAVGQPAADGVADGQCHEHGGDGVRPHDRARTEPRSKQPGRSDLCSQAGHPDAEHHDLEGDAGARVHDAKPIGAVLTPRAPHRTGFCERRKRFTGRIHG